MCSVFIEGRQINDAIIEVKPDVFDPVITFYKKVLMCGLKNSLKNSNSINLTYFA